MTAWPWDSSGDSTDRAHAGLRDEVEPGGPEYQYPTRELRGLTNAEREQVKDLLLQHLRGASRLSLAISAQFAMLH